MKRHRHHVRYALVIPVFLFLISIPVSNYYYEFNHTGLFINVCLSVLVVYLLIIYLLRERDNAAQNLRLVRRSVQFARSENQLNVIFNTVPAMIWYKDRKNNILRANQRAAASMGMTVDELEGKSTYELYPEHAKKYHEDDLEVIRSGNPKFGIIEPYETATGEKLWMCTDKIPYRDELGKIIGVIVFAKDITQLKKSEMMQKQQQDELKRVNNSLQSLVSTDSLTGLLNRRGLEEGIKVIIDDMKIRKTTAYALLLDLDNFKDVNHTFGFVVGDIEIRNVGQKIKTVLQGRGMVGRIGGDEYMVLVSDADHEEVLILAENLRIAVSEMIVGMSSGNAIKLTVSIGVVPMTQHSASLEELIERTYYALSQCKEWGKNTVNLSGKMGFSQTESGKTLSGMLREDSNNNSFYALHQSIVNLSDTSVYGYEMLIRLNDPYYKMPNDFFRLALESKILTFIDRLCLRTCLEESCLLNSDSKIHVNLFPSTLIQIPAQQLIEEFDRSFGLDRYCIEISEQQIIGNPSNLIRQVEAFKEAGIQVALDDLGFGSSCLESLIMLQPDIVKIDMSVVRGAGGNIQKLKNLNRITKVIHSCGALAVAEGIETLEDYEVVKNEGIPLGQGYLFSKPAKLPDAGNHADCSIPRII